MKAKLLHTLIFLLASTASFSQSLVDNPCSTPYPAGAQITVNAPCVNVSTAGMSALYNPSSCNSALADDGWAWFVGDGNQMTVTFANPTADAVLHVFEVVTSPCSVTQVGCSDNIGSGSGGTESVTFSSTNGTIYLIRIQRWASNLTTSGCLSVTSIAPPPPADYLQATAGINNEYVGNCLVSNCGPFTFADDGDTGGNYSNSINQIYRVFCPDQAGQCMKVTFNSFQTLNNLDFLLVKNGPTQNSPDFTTPPNSATAYAGITALNGDLSSNVPFSFTSSDPSGCLTFRFYSSSTGTASGWYATLECVPCAGGPNGTDNNDCVNATPICSTASINSNATGPGIAAEGCTGTACPAGGENHTNWYTFTVQSGGTLNFLIDPVDNTDDYDYAVYGPNVPCSNLGNPVRCSDSGVQGNTGLTNVSPNEFTEDVTGDGWTETMNVNTGDSYFLVIDEWSPNAGSGYQLSFSGTASLDCTILPVELVDFHPEYIPEEHAVALRWTTESERDNDRFDVEKSIDGINYEIIGSVKGSGNTTWETQYFALDPNPQTGVNYYRLNQWDIDGNGKYSEVVSVNVLDNIYDILSLNPNPTTGKTELIFNNYGGGEAMIKVVGADGKVIINTPVVTTKGTNRFTIDLSEHRDGIYLVSVVTGEKVIRARLAKE